MKLDYKAEAWATLYVGLEAAFIGLTQLRNTRDTLEIESFIEFNKRYSLLNEKLRECQGKPLTDLNEDLFKCIEDYINLCCEQYYCYRIKKQIPFRIWKFWHAGIMSNWNKCECLKELWEKEYSNANSFYIKDGDHPFKSEAIKKNKSRLRSCFEEIEKLFY